MYFSTSVIAAFIGSAVAREGIHFVKCSPANYEAINYYADDSKANSFPGASNTCIPSPNWHSVSQCTYTSGVRLSWNIPTNAESYAVGANVGTVNNGFHTYTCKRDDDHYAYTEGNGNRCTSVFYCLN
ncbi:hypothetical protein PG993_011344 [Apiospora rasikravindrae]|uniref:Uncharacterized protein n=1 Tax=Apiospora rasikravindrae TaxID=990691 RepID=A0ABR1SDZ3_9PEZI